jgi:hypothetical protein
LTRAVFNSQENRPRSRLGQGKNILIGVGFRADEDPLARMWTRAAASKPVGLPGDVRGGIFDGTEQSEDPAFEPGNLSVFQLHHSA